MHVVLLHNNGACRIIINKKVYTYTHTHMCVFLSTIQSRIADLNKTIYCSDCYIYNRYWPNSFTVNIFKLNYNIWSFHIISVNKRLHAYIHVHVYVLFPNFGSEHVTSVSDWHCMSVLRPDTLRDMNFWQGCCCRSKTNEMLHLELRDPEGEFTRIRRNANNNLTVDTA